MNRLYIIGGGAVALVLVVVAIFSIMQNSSTPPGADLSASPPPASTKPAPAPTTPAPTPPKPQQPTPTPPPATAVTASTVGAPAPLSAPPLKPQGEEPISILPVEQTPIKDDSGNNQPPIQFNPDRPKNKQPKTIGGTNPTTGIAPVPIPEELIIQNTPDQGNPENETKIPRIPRVPERRYLFDNRTPDALKGGQFVAGGNPNAFNPDTFAPEGELIDVALMENVASNQFEIPVTVGVWTPFYFQGHKLLETGTKILGTAAKGSTRSRILINFNRILFPDGSTNPINAMAMDMDGTVGVQGQMIGNSLLQQLTPSLMQAASQFITTFENRTVSMVQNPYTGTTTTITNVGNDLKSQGVQAGQDVINQLQQIITQDLNENQPYVLVIAGTRMKARLMSALDISKAELGYGSEQSGGGATPAASGSGGGAGSGGGKSGGLGAGFGAGLKGGQTQ